MTKTLGDKRDIVFSVAASLCVIVAVVFGLAWENADEIQLSALGRSLAFLSLVAVVGPFVCTLIYRPLLGIFPIALYLLFTFKTIYDSFPRTSLSAELSVAILAGILAAVFLWLRRYEVANVTRATLVVAAAMAMGTLFVAVPQFLDSRSVNLGDKLLEATISAASTNGVSPAQLPDIIYVVPDRYASQATLRSEFEYDNSSFYTLLRDRGFAVNPDAWANYPKTFQSLASTLNSEYLENFADIFGPDSFNQTPVNDKIENSRAQRELRALGYQFYNFGFWWGPTRLNKNADKNFIATSNLLSRLSRFERILAFKTPIAQILEKFNDRETVTECKFIKDKFENLRSIGNGSRPVFVFAHFAIPHDPIYMNSKGECLEESVTYPKGSSWEEFKAAYVGYTQFFNDTIIDIIDHQFRTRAQFGRELIFVIQSDEGPFPRSMRENISTLDFFEFSEDELRMKLGILNAVYLPGIEPGRLAELRTPINNWRIIFNHISDAKLEMLPDASFVFRDLRHIYDFRDVSYLIDKSKTKQSKNKTDPETQ